jgi:hypothetical protein
VIGSQGYSQNPAGGEPAGARATPKDPWQVAGIWAWQTLVGRNLVLETSAQKPLVLKTFVLKQLEHKTLEHGTLADQYLVHEISALKTLEHEQLEQKHFEHEIKIVKSIRHKKRSRPVAETGA